MNYFVSSFRMTNLLHKFRIDFSAVIEVHGVNNLPSSQRYYNSGSSLNDMNDKLIIFLNMQY